MITRSIQLVCWKNHILDQDPDPVLTLGFKSYVGCVFLNASTTYWPYWCFVVGITRLLTTWQDTSS